MNVDKSAGELPIRCEVSSQSAIEFIECIKSLLRFIPKPKISQLYLVSEQESAIAISFGEIARTQSEAQRSIRNPTENNLYHSTYSPAIFGV